MEVTSLVHTSTAGTASVRRDLVSAVLWSIVHLEKARALSRTDTDEESQMQHFTRNRPEHVIVAAIEGALTGICSCPDDDPHAAESAGRQREEARRANFMFFGQTSRSCVRARGGALPPAELPWSAAAQLAT